MPMPPSLGESPSFASRYARCEGWYRRRDSNPHEETSLDFESSASANSATPANCVESRFLYRLSSKRATGFFDFHNI